MTAGESTRYPDDPTVVAARVAVTGRLLLAGLALGGMGGLAVGLVGGVLAATSDDFWSLLLVLGTMLGMVVGVLAAACTALAARSATVPGARQLWIGALAGTAASWVVLSWMDLPRSGVLAAVAAVLSLGDTAAGLRWSLRSS
ncbi:MAG: hypothetical protein ACTHOD_01995 [Motilibacteraceae bacterium]